MTKLKPCPFCGGEAKFVHIFENPEKCMVSCRECDGGIDAVFANEEAAAEAWNRRAQHMATVDTVEVVRCRDCVHFGECLVTENDYCSKGERKENY